MMQKAQTSLLPSISVKAAMAVSGLLMAVWLTLHMLANLLVFAGPGLINGYALSLRASGLRLQLAIARWVERLDTAIGVSSTSSSGKRMSLSRIFSRVR